MNGSGHDGLKSFEMNGQTIKLKAGSMWVRRENGDLAGYNILYVCNKGDCTLILPQS